MKAWNIIELQKLEGSFGIGVDDKVWIHKDEVLCNERVKMRIDGFYEEGTQEQKEMALTLLRDFNLHK